MSRSDFPFFSKHPSLIYFDSAATTHKPKVVIEALSDFYAYNYATVHRAAYASSKKATEDYYAARKKVRHFLNAKSEEDIIFTKGTTASLNLVAQSFGMTFLQAGDSIAISEIEHHSNIVPWQMVAKLHGCHLKMIPVDDSGDIMLEEYEKLLKSGIKIVSVAHISNVLGVKHPIKKMIALAHENGAVFCVDGAQSAGHLSVDVQDLDADFFAFSGHKVYGPTGIGVLYGKRELLKKMVPIEGGGDMIQNVTFEETTYQDPPLRFEPGTPPIGEAMGLAKALEYVSSFGMDKIESEEAALHARTLAGLKEIPNLRVIGNSKEKGSIISFVCEKMHPLDIGMLLDCRGIAIRTGHQCSQPTMRRFQVSGTARVSFGLYNNREEVDFFLKSLREILA